MVPNLFDVDFPPIDGEAELAHCVVDEFLRGVFLTALRRIRDQILREA